MTYPTYECDEHLTDGLSLTKHYAAERLLAWGFDRAAIALMLGCSTEWVDSIAQSPALHEERWPA